MSSGPLTRSRKRSRDDAELEETSIEDFEKYVMGLPPDSPITYFEEYVMGDPLSTHDSFNYAKDMQSFIEASEASEPSETSEASEASKPSKCDEPRTPTEEDFNIDDIPLSDDVDDFVGLLPLSDDGFFDL